MFNFKRNYLGWNTFNFEKNLNGSLNKNSNIKQLFNLKFKKCPDFKEKKREGLT